MLKKEFRPRMPTKLAAAPFFAAAREAQLKLPYCTECGQVIVPGLRHCTHCLSDELTWRTASGRGTIYSYIVMNRQLHSEFPGGYAVCVVELEEGPRFVAEVVGVAPAQLTVGMPVRAPVIAPEAERAPLRFVPAHVTP